MRTYQIDGRRDYMIQEKTGYTTITYKFRLYDKHLDWLKKTKELYNQIVAYYYNIILENQSLLQLSNQPLLRELECRTVGTKEMKKNGEKPEYPLEQFPKIPLYFRRAAINAAVGLARSYISQKQAWEEKKSKRLPSITKKFSLSPVYYKGMYKEFTKTSIMLKIYTGNKWEWVSFHYKGREFPEEAQYFSPTIKIEEKTAYLHFPICKIVKDVRTMKERMEKEERILAIYFPSQDCLAVGVILQKSGVYEKSIFIHGGKELKIKRRELYKKSIQIKQTSNTDTQKYYKKIEDLNEHYAHKVSRKLVNYCLTNKIKVIAVPNYDRQIDFSKRNYIQTNNFEWIGRRIIRYLKYKAFAEGILVGTIRPYHITDICSICGEKIEKYNEGYRPGKNYYGGKLYLCPNGHKGNSSLNAAKNIGLHFLKFYN